MATNARWRNSLQAESFRQEFGDAGFLPTLSGGKEDDCLRTEFVNHLAASAAGSAGYVLGVDHRNRADFELRSRRGHCRKDRGTFGTVGHSIGGVSHVAT